MPGIRGIGPQRPFRRPVLATRTPQAQARGQARKGSKSTKIGASYREEVHFRQTGVDPVPDVLEADESQPLRLRPGGLRRADD
jgi:hypothetical protein